MVAVYVSSVALLIAAAAVGHAVCAAGGGERGPAWAPAVGFAALMVLARLMVELPGRATTAAVVCGVAAAGTLALRPVRRALRVGWGERLVLAAGVLVVATLPLLSSGRAGILGVGDNNDMSAHLTAAWWLDTHGFPQPLSATRFSLITQGYPLGPHALAATVSRALGVSVEHAFDAVTIVVPVLAALAALAAMPARAPRVVRVAAAGLVGLAYLAAAYLAQGAFKETVMGMLVVALAVAVRALLRAGAPAPARAGLPLGVLIAGAVYVYSIPGLLWPVFGFGALVVFETVARRGLWRVWRPALPAALTAGAVLAVLGAFEIGHMTDFASSSFANQPDEGLGNLNSPLPAAEALGVWLRGDFRFHPHPTWLAALLAALVLAALVAALVWWLRRRDLAVAAALLGAGAVALDSHYARSPYNTAKSLAVLAPVVALALFPALAAAWRGRGRAVVAARVLGVVIALAAAASSVAALRDAPVGPSAHLRQLRALATSIPGRSVLYLNADDFAQWELRGTRPATQALLYTPEIAHRWPLKPAGETAAVDVDSFDAATLDRYGYLITTAAAYQSHPPANFRVVRRTSAFVLWRRTGPTPARKIIEPTDAPGAILRCGTPSGRDVVAGGGSAEVWPTPVVGPPSGWAAQPFTAGTSGHQTLRVPAGRWDVSLQYVSTTPLTVRGPGLRVRLPANLERMSAFWPAGTVTQQRAGSLLITVSSGRPGWIGRLLGAPARTRALGPDTHAPLGAIALTRSGARPRSVPVRAACGRYVDWYVAGG